MRKIPSLFIRDWSGDRSRVTETVDPECQWVIDREGVATRKWDGTAVLVRDGALYKRYDAKRGKMRPPGFEPAQPHPDAQTGHWPGWLPVGTGPEDKHYIAASDQEGHFDLPDGTYELCGPPINGNNERLDRLYLFKHGGEELHVPNPITYSMLHSYLGRRRIEGIVWHHPDGRMAKIKRRDFGWDWPVSEFSDAR